MGISIVKINSEEQPILLNLLKMYCYEWSQYNLFDVDDLGEYSFEKHLKDYFEEQRRNAFFIKVDGILAGFALIDDDFVIHKDYDYSMGEFFVMHKYRHNGIGKYVATQLFSMFLGKWEVGYNSKNTISEFFWANVIGEYTSGNYAIDKDCKDSVYHDGSLGNVLSFDNSKF